MALEDPGILAQITAGFGVALSALGTWAWKHTHKRIDGVEEKTVLRDQFQMHSDQDERLFLQLKQELSEHRADIGQIFNQMRDMEKNSHERHIALLNAIYTNGNGHDARGRV